LGLRFRAVDLVLLCDRKPLQHDPSALQDMERVATHLGVSPDPAIEAAIDELVQRIEQAGGRTELVAISVDRGSQTALVAALAVELKRRWGARLIVGGVSMRNLRSLLERTGAQGPDVVTTAFTPAQIARAFQVLLELPRDRRAAPIEPNEELVPLSRALIDARLDLRWSDSLRVRPLPPERLELMARAGCASIRVGVESASQHVLKAMVKGHQPEHASAMVRNAHACEMMLRINILTCFPGETWAELDETCAWVREHAFAIDDLAPSSFYLTSDSPIGRHPERFGIVLRGSRALAGPNRFRKSPDSLAYDEVEGYSWEEREPMLDASEAQVRAAWEQGRAGHGSSGALSPSTMLALRRRFATKREIHEYLAGPPAPEEADAPRVEPLTAHLVSPRRPAPALERIFTLAFEEVLPTIASHLAPDATAHALLFPDGSSCFFRGSVVRDARDHAHSITLDERLGAVAGPAARDARAMALHSGARLDADAIKSTLGHVAVLTFRVSARTGSESL